MGYLNFYDKLNSMKDREYVETFLIFNLSLVIAGVKPAVTLTIKKENYKLYNNWGTLGNYFIKNLNLEYIELRETEKSIVALVYDKNLLKKHLKTKDSIEFLNNLGYPYYSSVSDYVLILKERYNNYHCPHELGLFLGIPIKDVIDFMQCTTKKCLMCKYWKVYNDSAEAEITFNTYDKIKEYTMKNILNGKSLNNLITNIKQCSY